MTGHKLEKLETRSREKRKLVGASLGRQLLHMFTLTIRRP
jgi:hypothetical protein